MVYLEGVSCPEAGAGTVEPDHKLIPIGGSSKSLTLGSVSPAPHWAAPKGQWSATGSTLARGPALLLAHKYLEPDVRPARPPTGFPLQLLLGCIPGAPKL